MSTQIVSIYTFDLKSAANEQDFIRASAKLDELLLAVKGFHYRSLTRITEGQWQDIVFWDSEEDLKRADAMDSEPTFNEFISFIEGASIKNRKASLYSSVYPGMESPALSQSA